MKFFGIINRFPKELFISHQINMSTIPQYNFFVEDQQHTPCNVFLSSLPKRPATPYYTTSMTSYPTSLNNLSSKIFLPTLSREFLRSFVLQSMSQNGSPIPFLADKFDIQTIILFTSLRVPYHFLQLQSRAFDHNFTSLSLFPPPFLFRSFLSIHTKPNGLFGQEELEGKEWEGQ